eukprot:gene11069-3136_t
MTNCLTAAPPLGPNHRYLQQRLRPTDRPTDRPAGRLDRSTGSIYYCLIDSSEDAFQNQRFELVLQQAQPSKFYALFPRSVFLVQLCERNRKLPLWRPVFYDRFRSLGLNRFRFEVQFYLSCADLHALQSLSLSA